MLEPLSYSEVRSLTRDELERRLTESEIARVKLAQRCGSAASDTDRVSTLEREVADLRARCTSLEAELGAARAFLEEATAPSGKRSKR